MTRSQFWMIAVSLLGTSCSFITDFDPSKQNGGGAGGMSGAGGNGGNGGSGGMMIDAPHIDARPIDAAIDARPDAPLICTGSSQCDDGFACTSDFCSFPAGMCVHTANNNFCYIPNLCTRDTCDPSNPDHYADGCVHRYIMCMQGEICQESQGCIVVSCNQDGDCPAPADCCKQPRCQNHACNEVPRCDGGQMCVRSSNGTCACQ